MVVVVLPRNQASKLPLLPSHHPIPPLYPVRLSLCLSLSPSVCLSPPSLCLSHPLCLSVCLSLSLPLSLSPSLSVCLSVSPSLSLTLSVCLSLPLSLPPSLSVCLSLSLPLSLSPSLCVCVSLPLSVSPPPPLSMLITRIGRLVLSFHVRRSYKTPENLRGFWCPGDEGMWGGTQRAAVPIELVLPVPRCHSRAIFDCHRW